MAKPDLDKETRARLVNVIQKYLDDELEVNIGNMDAELLIEFLSSNLGASFYNLGLKDAQALFQRKADDLADELYAMERMIKDRD